MSTIRTWAMIAGTVLLFGIGSGCVSQDEYLREKFARRKATERAETLERDLADERNRVLALEAERESLRGQLETAQALAETLKAERDRLSELNGRLMAQLEGIDRPGDIRVVEVKLPPELDKALKEFASQYPEAVEYDPQRGAVRWKSDLTFAIGSDEVQSQVMDSLARFAEICKSAAASQFEVVIVGHTDNLRIGPVTAKKHPSNWHLSVHRAISVMNVLARGGVQETRLGVMGYGEWRPRVPNPARGGSEANRRVEIFLVSSREPIPDQTALGAEG